MGSLSVKIRVNTEDDPFWQTLHSLLKQDTETNFLACEIYGIVVSPQVRREGIASSLLGRMIEDLNPQIIFGQTNAPESVLLRSRISKLYGYRTFYGYREVTLSSDYKAESDGFPFIQASFIDQDAQPSESGVYFINARILPANIPNTQNFPPEIQRAFEQLQKAQRLVGKRGTAVTTLVSVQNRFFKDTSRIKT